MLGTIEYHGAKQVLHVNENRTIPVNSSRFIPGDLVTVDTMTLFKRQPQAICAIVQGPRRYYIANLLPVCPFQPVLDLDQPAGTRILMWLDATGGEHILNTFSSDPRDDMRVTLGLYSATDSNPQLEEDPGIESKEPARSLYSRNDIVDHTDQDVFTIDPVDSKDFDDALSVEVATNTVYVHIVDIAHADLTKTEETRLRDRCLTLYLANEHVEHLLDPATASDRLSLIVGSPRATITVKLVLSEGKVIHYEIYRSVIRVARRYTYEEVAGLLAGHTASEELQYLDRLASQRSSSVNYNLALPSARLTVDTTSGLALEIRMEDTQDSAHQLVATAMILANLTVSKHLGSRGLVLPNRFHAALRGVSHLESTIDTGNIVVDSFIRVKTFARARYTVDEKGHFGLGLTDYVHFTSPMRRYADVLVHRLLAGLPIPDLEEQVNYINYRSHVVRGCQEMYERWKIVRYLATLVGPLTVYITGLAKAGVQWFMPSLSLNGFSHVSCLEPVQFWTLIDNRLQGATASVQVGRAYTAVIKSIDPITSVIQLRIQIV